LVVFGSLMTAMFVSYLVYYSGLKPGVVADGTSPAEVAWHEPFTRSRMVMRTNTVLFGLGAFAVLFALLTASFTLSPELAGKPVLSLVQLGGSQAPPAKTQGAGARLYPGEEDGGYMTVAGACGDTVAAGALSGALGLLGFADLVALFLAAVLALPTMCPCCPGARCGEREPPLTRVPLRLAPAGLVWPPSRRQTLRDAIAKVASPGTSGEASIDGVLRSAGLSPWEEVQVESWFECDATGMPVNDRERLVRDALLAELATAPDAEDPAGARLGPGWAMTLEAKELGSVARDAYEGAMRRRFGVAAVDEGSGVSVEVDTMGSRVPRVRQRFLAE
jgi:hypothetical protein